MDQFEPDDYERAAGGLDYDEPEETQRGAAGGGADWQARLEQEGPLALLDDVEEMLPEPVREQVVRFPLAAVCLGVGVGIFLGARKSEPIIAAITAAVTANATRSLGSILGD